MAGISESEVAVYDRQLRLWGVEAQQRLLKSKVLVWGLEGSNVEVCKNLILAGVSVTVRDHRNVGGSDIGFNYFLRKEDLGLNRSECATRRLQEMNPLCKVASCTAGPEQDAAGIREALKDFDVLLLGLGVLHWNVDRVCAIDAACRELHVNFALSVGVGELAFFLTNFHDHVVKEHSSAQGGASVTGAASQVSEAIQFPSFREWLDCAPATMKGEGVDASFVLIALVIQFLRTEACPTEPAAAARFDDYCRTVAKCTPVVDGISGLKVAYSCFFVDPLVHVASVLGGLLAQEVIKAITQRDTPLTNCVCFNAYTGTALVERIPAPPKELSKKRKVEETFDLDD